MVVGLTACQTAPVPEHRLTEAQVAALKQEGFEPAGEGWEFSASDKLLFGYDEATLEPNARQVVERIGRMLVTTHIPHVRVDGHSDAVGGIDYNVQLSLRRAQSVADALVGAGVAAATIEVRGLGKSAPIASNQTAEGRMQNRRVAIVIFAE
jgi:outer membrane protein OmpA-like peptidoglycan-associated protein